jgi:hypothetical protein
MFSRNPLTDERRLRTMTYSIQIHRITTSYLENVLAFQGRRGGVDCSGEEAYRRW